MQHGVILEMNDWKNHFLAGTKGMKKTEPVILDYVENLLNSVYEDKDKVRNNRLAPWLVSQVQQIGIKNIGTDDRNKFLSVIEWVKEVGGEGNIPKMNLQQAHDFSVAALEKRHKQKQAEKPAQAPAAEIPELPDEKAGLIKRVWVLPDGSGRMWVKVLKNKWLDKQCEAGKDFGIGCQRGGGWASHNTYTLIGPPKGKPEGIKSTIVSMAVSKETKGINELKQEGNQQPGHQKTSGGWDDVAEQVINFIAFSPEARTNIHKFYTYSDHEPGATGRGYDGGAGALYFIMDKNPELLNRLVTARPSMKEENKNIILAHPKFGKKWYESFGIDVSKYAQENPVKFIENLESYEYLGSELWKIIEKLNIDEIAAKHPKLVLSKIDKLLGNLSVDIFKKLLDTLNIPNYIKTNRDQFANMLKMMSAAKNPKYKELMVEIINGNIDNILEAYGGGIKGLYDFLDAVSMPKMHRFSRKGSDGQMYAIKTVTVVDRETGNRTITDEEFPLRDDLVILPQKERRKLIEKNKEKIKSFFKGTDEEKEIKFLRVLFRETNPQDVERTLKNEKEKFIKYYDKHPSSATGFPGILEFYSVINKNKPGYVSSKSSKGEEATTKIYFKMDPADLRDRDIQRKLLLYYFHKSKSDNPTAKKYEAAEDLLQLMDFSGESKETILDFVKKEFSPKQVVGKTPSAGDYVIFINMMSKFLSGQDLRALIESYKDDITASGIIGYDTYKDLLYKYSEKGYKVKPGDMVEYNKRIDMETYSSEDDEGIYLTRGRKYRVADTRDDVNIKNNYIEVIDDRKQKSWHPSRDFDLKVVNLQENVRKYVRKKIMEKYVNKLMESKTKKPNFSAVVLDEKSRSKLFERFQVPDGWEKIAHHMTITMGELDDKALLGKEFDMRVVEIASDDKVMAVRVETDAPSKKSIKHVTIAVNRIAGGKPAMSNNLKNWEPVKTPFFISGTVEEVYM